MMHQGNHYMIVFQDSLAKWPLVYPAPDQKNIAKLVSMFGVPKSVLSNGGFAPNKGSV